VFIDGDIDGVVVKKLQKFTDRRGWLIELFRHDELDTAYHPVMSYVSMTEVGVKRGPHEHRDQADLFCFLGPSTFKVVMWDNRKGSPTYCKRMIVLAGEGDPKSVLVPPGVVHAYENVGGTMGMVFNAPNQLFAGKGRAEPVDEIRHENDPSTVFQLP
jgi:dTDP-4-dehydrorhamnose 3,5-epimerase